MGNFDLEFFLLWYRILWLSIWSWCFVTFGL